VNILGFNSKKFDVNVFINYITDKRIHIKNVIGTTSQYKLLSMSHDDYPFELHFKDLAGFLAGGELDENAKTFSGVQNRVKGVFPYEAITTKNYREILSKTEPFDYADFYSSLRGCNISLKEYEEYLDVAKNFKTRLDYLLYYNVLDTQIMFPIINALVEKFQTLNVDLLRNFSLSACAAEAKYAMAYKDFDINGDYSTTAETTFTLTEEHFKEMILNYIQQDRTAKRTTIDNISIKDFAHIKQLLETSKCYLCNEGFTEENKPTLDRIDNFKGHTLQNVKPACCYCNRYKSNNDAQTTKLYIQLRKFAILNNLPFTMASGDEEEYQVIREGIIGGLSNVHNRCNIKGVDTIKNLEYKDGKINIIDTGNKITHCLGLDFNSLYPSVYSGTQHIENPYTDHICICPEDVFERFTIKKRFLE
jgi:hypothetical protein